MRVVLERVKEASVSVDGETVASIPFGYLLLTGLTHSDDETVVGKMAQKIANLRIMSDEQGKLNKTLAEAGGEVLAVSQFTLYADISGRRPGFKDAAKPEQAQTLFDNFVAQLISQNLKVEKGVFGSYMDVKSTNDGPLTLVLEL